MDLLFNVESEPRDILADNQWSGEAQVLTYRLVVVNPKYIRKYMLSPYMMAAPKVSTVGQYIMFEK